MATYQCQTCGQYFTVPDSTTAAFDEADWKHYNENRAAHLNRIHVPHILVVDGELD